jgi:GMP synthase-like glutamine amidotransferase
MNVHVFQHVPFEGPGLIADWCLSKGHSLATTHFYVPSTTLPDTDQVDLLVILGGPMSVYDEATLPWLREEKTFITSFLQMNKPILGICLGTQNLAYTDANDNQAFLLKGKALGLQFHPEIKKDGLQQMVSEEKDELQEGAYIQSAETILNTSSFDGSHLIMRMVLEHLTGSFYP